MAASSSSSAPVPAAVSPRNTPADVFNEDPGDGLAQAQVVLSPGLRTVDMGNGRTCSAETLKLGDKLGMAAQCNDLSKVKKLIRKGVEVNIRNAGSGVTPLGVAAERGHIQMVGLLLDAKALVDDATNEGMTPLHICSQFGQIEVVRRLVRAKADVNAVASRLPFGLEDHLTPLMSAVVRNSLPTVEALVAAKADVNLMPPRSVDSALHIACRLGRYKALPLLMEHTDANPTLRNRRDETPLEAALVTSTTKGHFKCMAHLRPLQSTDTVPALADKTNDYICSAMKRLSMRIADQLAPVPGPDGKVEDEDLDQIFAIPTELLSAFMRAGAEEGNFKMIKELATTHPDLVNDRNPLTGFTALHGACRGGHVGMAAALIARSADVKAAAVSGATPLHEACVADVPLIVQLLCKHGADPTAQDGAGKTPADVAGPNAKEALDQLQSA